MPADTVALSSGQFPAAVSHTVALDNPAVREKLFPLAQFPCPSSLPVPPSDQPSAPGHHRLLLETLPE